MSPSEEQDARALEVLMWNRGGVSLEAIARRYGVTKQRASQLRLRGLELEKMPLAENELTARTRNALINWGITPRPEYVAKFFKGNEAELLRVVNMGVKCRKELKAWLARHGQQEIAERLPLVSS